ncbi:hypothetical protein DEU56DRAFT_452399 [Suillus clintonianus]|uniref:uncharacterized protein n=1 Tax=Suillus clintonianus TaxID=1904413 RepID=UPI001B876C9A|nr:uncharacterized protein DEU56DRAFT_452399 [Suillus clintonianus]KAG2131820.1 hypothetical protein DEU56DRAFT_452399 [Suillus clintonianus]
MEPHTPLTAALLMTGRRRALPIDSYGEPFTELTDSNIPSQGSLNGLDMNHSTFSTSLSYDNNYRPLDLLEPSQTHGTTHLSKIHSHHDCGITDASSLDETALFVANYLHQMRLTFGTGMTVDQAIRICSGQWDTPDPDPMHGQMGIDEFGSNISSPSTSHTGSQSSRSATRQSSPSERASFRSSAVMQTDHEIFRDNDRIKVRCLEGPCNGNVLMKDNYARHVREHHFGCKRKVGGSSRRGVRLGTK